jgi:uncharacterized protein YdhG (YjbR/CyaY superfamily)
MRLKAKSFDAYFAALPRDKRAAMDKVRKAIHAAAPGVEECVSYGLPAFRYNGKVLAALGAAENHCAYYPMSGTTVDQLKEELKEYDTSKGTIRFPANKALPQRLVAKLVKARIAEISGT